MCYTWLCLAFFQNAIWSVLSAVMEFDFTCPGYFKFVMIVLKYFAQGCVWYAVKETRILFIPRMSFLQGLNNVYLYAMGMIMKCSLFCGGLRVLFIFWKRNPVGYKVRMLLWFILYIWCSCGIYNKCLKTTS